MRASSNANNTGTGVARGRCRRTFVFNTSMRTASLIKRSRNLSDRATRKRDRRGINISATS